MLSGTLRCPQNKTKMGLHSGVGWPCRPGFPIRVSNGVFSSEFWALFGLVPERRNRVVTRREISDPRAGDSQCCENSEKPYNCDSESL